MEADDIRPERGGVQARSEELGGLEPGAALGLAAEGRIRREGGSGAREVRHALRQKVQRSLPDVAFFQRTQCRSQTAGIRPQGSCHHLRKKRQRFTPHIDRCSMLPDYGSHGSHQPVVCKLIKWHSR